MKTFSDIELLSAYLDGQLDPSDSARLESRLSSDPELASVFNDLRLAREVLRKLPARKAPRNFILTRKMVGIKPPLPRAYSALRFSGAFATLLLLISFAANLLVPRISFGAAASAPEVGYGGGGPGMGGGCAEPCGFEPSLQVAAPATEAPAMEMLILPTVTPLPTSAVPIGTLFPPSVVSTGTLLSSSSILIETPPSTSADIARESVTSIPENTMPKEGESTLQAQDQFRARSEVVPVAWQVGLLIVLLSSFLITFAIDRSAKRKWR